MKQEDIEYLIIHCSATKRDQDIGRKDIDRWHRKRGWLKIGYHYVIRRDGTTEEGRKESEPGAHAYGYNTKSLGICMVGGIDDQENAENNFTPEQWEALAALIWRLETKYPTAKIIGHRDVEPRKECPSFSVEEWMKAREKPLE